MNKPHWLLLTDTAEIKAVKDAGKYRAITWQRLGDEIWVKVDAIWKNWRAERDIRG